MTAPSPFPPAPREPIDASGAPVLGAFAGAPERVDLSALTPGLRGRFRRLASLKRWQFFYLQAPEVELCFSIVDAGYAATAFCFAVDRKAGTLLFDKGGLGLPGVSVEVGDSPGSTARSRFDFPGVALRFERVMERYVFAVRFGKDVELDGTLDTRGMPSPFTLVAPVPEGTLNVTTKSVLLPAQGHLRVGERRWSLDGGFGGLDYTHGLLARVTNWRWGFGVGRDEGQTPIAFNLGQGFNEGAAGENVLWWGDLLAPLPPVEFHFDAKAPLGPWRVSSKDGAVDLRFRSHGMHREDRNLVLAVSRFAQVLGEWSGTVRLPDGRVARLGDVSGVAEDQYVRW